MRTRHRLVMLAVLVGAALLLGACGGSGPEQQPSEAAGTPSGEWVQISMSATAFEPEDVTISPGTAVVWVNDDDASHDVVKASGPGESFGSGNLNPGERFQHRFTEPGTVEIECTYHPSMTGTITVEE